jgi:hypothetical protein
MSDPLSAVIKMATHIAASRLAGGHLPAFLHAADITDIVTDGISSGAFDLTNPSALSSFMTDIGAEANDIFVEQLNHHFPLMGAFDEILSNATGIGIDDGNGNGVGEFSNFDALGLDLRLDSSFLHDVLVQHFASGLGHFLGDIRLTLDYLKAGVEPDGILSELIDQMKGEISATAHDITSHYCHVLGMSFLPENVQTQLQIAAAEQLHNLHIEALHRQEVLDFLGFSSYEIQGSEVLDLLTEELQVFQSDIQNWNLDPESHLSSFLVNGGATRPGPGHHFLNTADAPRYLSAHSSNPYYLPAHNTALQLNDADLAEGLATKSQREFNFESYPNDYQDSLELQESQNYRSEETPLQNILEEDTPSLDDFSNDNDAHFSSFSHSPDEETVRVGSENDCLTIRQYQDKKLHIQWQDSKGSFNSTGYSHGRTIYDSHHNKVGYCRTGDGKVFDWDHNLVGIVDGEGNVFDIEGDRVFNTSHGLKGGALYLLCHPFKAFPLNNHPLEEIADKQKGSTCLSEAIENFIELFGPEVSPNLSYEIQHELGDGARIPTLFVIQKIIDHHLGAFEKDLSFTSIQAFDEKRVENAVLNHQAVLLFVDPHTLDSEKYPEHGCHAILLTGVDLDKQGNVVYEFLDSNVEHHIQHCSSEVISDAVEEIAWKHDNGPKVLIANRPCFRLLSSDNTVKNSREHETLRDSSEATSNEISTKAHDSLESELDQITESVQQSPSEKHRYQRVDLQSLTDAPLVMPGDESSVQALNTSQPINKLSIANHLKSVLTSDSPSTTEADKINALSQALVSLNSLNDVDTRKYLIAQIASIVEDWNGNEADLERAFISCLQVAGNCGHWAVQQVLLCATRHTKNAIFARDILIQGVEICQSQLTDSYEQGTLLGWICEYSTSHPETSFEVLKVAFLADQEIQNDFKRKDALEAIFENSFLVPYGHSVLDFARQTVQGYEEPRRSEALKEIDEAYQKAQSGLKGLPNPRFEETPSQLGQPNASPSAPSAAQPPEAHSPLQQLGERQSGTTAPTPVQPEPNAASPATSSGGWTSKAPSPLQQLRERQSGATAPASAVPEANMDVASPAAPPVAPSPDAGSVSQQSGEQQPGSTAPTPVEPEPNVASPAAPSTAQPPEAHSPLHRFVEQQLGATGPTPAEPEPNAASPAAPSVAQSPNAGSVSQQSGEQQPGAAAPTSAEPEPNAASPAAPSATQPPNAGSVSQQLGEQQLGAAAPAPTVPPTDQTVASTTAPSAAQPPEAHSPLQQLGERQSGATAPTSAEPEPNVASPAAPSVVPSPNAGGAYQQSGERQSGAAAPAPTVPPIDQTVASPTAPSAAQTPEAHSPLQQLGERQSGATAPTSAEPEPNAASPTTPSAAQSPGAHSASQQSGEQQPGAAAPAPTVPPIDQTVASPSAPSVTQPPKAHSPLHRLGERQSDATAPTSAEPEPNAASPSAPSVAQSPNADSVSQQSGEQQPGAAAPTSAEPEPNAASPSAPSVAPPPNAGSASQQSGERATGRGRSNPNRSRDSSRAAQHPLGEAAQPSMAETNPAEETDEATVLPNQPVDTQPEVNSSECEVTDGDQPTTSPAVTTGISSEHQGEEQGTTESGGTSASSKTPAPSPMAGIVDRIRDMGAGDTSVSSPESSDGHHPAQPIPVTYSNNSYKGRYPKAYRSAQNWVNSLDKNQPAGEALISKFEADLLNNSLIGALHKICIWMNQTEAHWNKVEEKWSKLDYSERATIIALLMVETMPEALTGFECESAHGYLTDYSDPDKKFLCDSLRPVVSIVQSVAVGSAVGIATGNPSTLGAVARKIAPFYSGSQLMAGGYDIGQGIKSMEEGQVLSGTLHVALAVLGANGDLGDLARALPQMPQGAVRKLADAPGVLHSQAATRQTSDLTHSKPSQPSTEVSQGDAIYGTNSGVKRQDLDGLAPSTPATTPTSLANPENLYQQQPHGVIGQGNVGIQPPSHSHGIRQEPDGLPLPDNVSRSHKSNNHAETGETPANNLSREQPDTAQRYSDSVEQQPGSKHNPANPEFNPLARRIYQEFEEDIRSGKIQSPSDWRDMQGLAEQIRDVSKRPHRDGVDVFAAEKLHAQSDVSERLDALSDKHGTTLAKLEELEEEYSHIRDLNALHPLIARHRLEKLEKRIAELEDIDASTASSLNTRNRQIRGEIGDGELDLRVRSEKGWIDRAHHDIGVLHGRAKLEEEGLELLDEGKDWINPKAHIGAFGQGIDDIARDPLTGKLVIVEYKGGDSKPKKGQMGRSWVQDKIEELRAVEENNEIADKLQKALDSGQLEGRIYTTQINADRRPIPTIVRNIQYQGK